VGLALDLEDYHPSVLLHCWLGHLTCKIVSEMTYNVSSGTLNPTIPYHFNKRICYVMLCKYIKVRYFNISQMTYQNAEVRLVIFVLVSRVAYGSGVSREL